MRRPLGLPLVFGLLLVIAASAGADVLKLGQGRVIEGKIVKETADTYFVDVGYTILSVPKKEVLARESATSAKKTEGKDGADQAKQAKGQLYSTIRRQEQSVKDNVKRTGASVVMITTPSGLGSGFIITPDGYVITNDHVIQGDTEITVVLFERGKDGTLARRKISKVKIVAINPYVDLALIKMEGVKDLPISYLGDSDALKVGQAVFAIGNPHGLDRTVSEGIVSITNRPSGGLTYIQTTAAVNPGNSGGPLFNLKGEVVGVTNMIRVQSEGLNFAIPVEAVKRFLRDREAFAYDKDNPNSGYRYMPPPPKPGKPSKQ